MSDSVYIQTTKSEALKALLKKARDNGLFKEVRQEAIKLANDARERILRSMRNTGKASWFYLRPNETIHFPSAPGYPPAIDTGRLLNSIRVYSEDDNIMVGDAAVDYGIYLEYGTAKMKPRPFIEPVFDWMDSVLIERLSIPLKKLESI